MKLSIIIPVYKVEATLNRCLQSVTGQSFRDLEIILVDDGSPDDCPRLCDEWAKRDQRIQVIHKQNGGLSDARNAGIEVARGALITFVDSDDFLEEDTYEQLIPLTEQADIVEFPLYRFYGSARQSRIMFPETSFTSAQDYWLKGYGYEHCYAWNKIFHHELFEQIRFPVGKVFEDVATMPALLRKSKRIVTSNKGLYYYCANEKGITANATGEELQMLLESHVKLLPEWYDARYYMHVLNIQLDVCRLTGRQPIMQRQLISPFSQGLSAPQRLKAFLQDLTGINGLCKINKITHRN